MPDERKDFDEWAKEHMVFPEDFIHNLMADKEPVEPDIEDVAFSLGEEIGKMYAATAKGLMAAGVPENHANKIAEALIMGKVLAIAKEL